MTFIGGRGEAKSKPSWIKLTREVVPSWLLQIISCTRNASPGNSENVTNKAFWFSFCNWIKRTFCKQFRHYDAMQLSNGLNKYKMSINRNHTAKTKFCRPQTQVCKFFNSNTFLVLCSWYMTKSRWRCLSSKQQPASLVQFFSDINDVYCPLPVAANIKPPLLKITSSIWSLLIVICEKSRSSGQIWMLFKGILLFLLLLLLFCFFVFFSCVY